MELSTLYRECTLNQVSENDIGKERRVAGWVENIRDHGGVSFVDLRDMYGVLQIVMRDTSLLKGTRRSRREPSNWKRTALRFLVRYIVPFRLKSRPPRKSVRICV